MEAVYARVTGTWVAGSLGDETVEVLNQAVVLLLSIAQQQQVYVRYVAELGDTERVYGVLVPEDVHADVVLMAPDVPERDGERDAGHVELRLVMDVVR